MKRATRPSAIGLVMLLLGLAMACESARAQTEATPPPPRPDQNVFFYQRMGPGPMAPDDGIAFMGFEEDLGGKTVTAAPFSATITTQTSQVLADGNHIDRTTTGTIARDSQGRTRRDMALPALGSWTTSGQASPHVVFINDNVSGTQYVLQPDRKTARRLEFLHGHRHGGRTANSQFVPRSETEGTNNQTNVTTTLLGTQTINGVQAEGTRVTRTIPAGAIGNANPIVITHERWYSTELQTVVMIKRSDPRMGQTTFQLTNIQKQEPDATLFQVPSDYTVMQGRPKHFKHGAGQALPPPPQD
jgi:hypothetical protein